MLVYRYGMTKSTWAQQFVTNVLRTHLCRRGTQWRVLSSGQQALVALAHLEESETYRDLSVGFSVGTTTTCRYLCEGRPCSRPPRPQRRRFARPRTACAAPRAVNCLKLSRPVLADDTQPLRLPRWLRPRLAAPWAGPKTTVLPLLHANYI